MSGDTKKLAVLRARTDHDLVVLLQRELDRAFSLLAMGSGGGSPLVAQAQRSVARAAVLLPKISGLSQSERLKLESRLLELQCRLNQLPVFAKERCFPASVAS